MLHILNKIIDIFCQQYILTIKHWWYKTIWFQLSYYIQLYGYSRTRIKSTRKVSRY